ncbi:hypothetical protein O3P69_006822 [Scylla paramamosain]|uniref:Uncharacterized protein n=1 Tax=Scylla paramamosain TaxID=85552 RepID=A0AAW0U139_SCYPA
MFRITRVGGLLIALGRETRGETKDDWRLGAGAGNREPPPSRPSRRGAAGRSCQWLRRDPPEDVMVTFPRIFPWTTQARVEDEPVYTWRDVWDDWRDAC